MGYGIREYKTEMRMDKDKKEIVYSEIDIEGLANCLAIDAWKIETQNTKDDDLHEINVILDPNGNTAEIVKTVRSYWQTTFWALQEGYRSLIRSYSKTSDTHDSQGSNYEGP